MQCTGKCERGLSPSGVCRTWPRFHNVGTAYGREWLTTQPQRLKRGNVGSLSLFHIAGACVSFPGLAILLVRLSLMVYCCTA